MSVKPNTSAGKLSWSVAGANDWQPLGFMTECPFIAPERRMVDADPIGTAYHRKKFVQQKPRDVTLRMNIINFVFVAAVLQSDPAPAETTNIRTFVYRSDYPDDTLLIDVAYDDGVIRYLAENCVVKMVKLTAADGEIPYQEITLSVPKISSVGADPDGGGTLVAFSETNEIGAGTESLVTGSGTMEVVSATLTLEPRIQHGNVIGAAYDETVNYGNLKVTLEFEAFYDSTPLASLGAGATWTPDPTVTYTFQIGNSAGEVATHNYIKAVLANPTEESAEFTLKGDDPVKIKKTLNANAATITAVDAEYDDAKYWVT